MSLPAHPLILQIITDCRHTSHPSNNHRYGAAKQALELEQSMGNYPCSAMAYDYAIQQFAKVFLDGSDAR